MDKILILSNYNESLITDMESYFIVREGTNKPEYRQQLLVQELEKHYTSIKTKPKLTSQDLIKLGVHSPEYLYFLENCYLSWKGFQDEQYLSFQGNGIMPLTQCQNRTSDFYNKVIHKLVPYRQLGYFMDDNMSPIYENTFEVALASANVCFQVSDYLQQYRNLYISCTYPGHHAKYNSGGGYCFINNSFTCALSLKAKSYKVCILDLDYHHGNGTQDIGQRHSDILTISLHANPEYDFPLYEGYEDESTRSNLNIIFPKKSTYKDYKKCLDQALESIKEFNPDVIVVAFGFDTYKKDTDASQNYGCNLDIADYKSIGQELQNLGKQVCVIQEGGYCLEDGPQIVYNLLSGLSQ